MAPKKRKPPTAKTLLREHPGAVAKRDQVLLALCNADWLLVDPASDSAAIKKLATAIVALANEIVLELYRAA